jgi:hypothetical protein
MDQLLAGEITRIQSAALEKLAITIDDLELTGDEWDPLAQLEAGASLHDPGRRRPLVVFSPHEDAREGIGADGRSRFSDYGVMVICPTHFSLGLYLCAVDILSGAMRGEDTWEYHYDDVVAISTITVGDQDTPRLPRDDEFHFARTIQRELQIVASSGDCPAIPVVVRGHGQPNRVTVEWSEIENVIAAVRRVLRDRKSAGRLERL